MQEDIEMAATKEQERKALEKIKKIVTDLGEDSYISMALRDALKLPRETLKMISDAAWNREPKVRRPEAAKYKEMYESAVKDYEAEKRTVEELEQKVLTLEEAGAIKAILIDSKTER